MVSFFVLIAFIVDVRSGVCTVSFILKIYWSHYTSCLAQSGHVVKINASE